MHHFVVTFPATKPYTRSYTLTDEPGAIALRAWLEAQDVQFEYWFETPAPFDEAVTDITTGLRDCRSSV